MLIQLQADNFVSTIKQEKLVVVYFYADWCGPCRRFNSIYDEVAANLEEQAIFCRVDIDEEDRLTQKFSVRQIPTILFFKRRHHKGRLQGVLEADFLMEEVGKRLNG